MATTPRTAPELKAGLFGAESGYWIRNGRLEAFVTAQDRIRMLALRRIGGGNLFSATGALTDGLRCWLMTPHDNEDERDELASRAGRIQAGEGRLHVETSESPTGLALTWTVSIDREDAAISVIHAVRNVGTAAREIALWPVIGIAPGARLVLPFSPAGQRASDARAFYHFPWSTLQDPRISAGPDHLELAIRNDYSADAHIKFGVFHASGSGAALIGDDVLISHTALETGRPYPEGGPNLTVYASPAVNGQAVGELENVGALHVLEPGHAVQLQQVLTLEDTTDSAFLTSVAFPGPR